MLGSPADVATLRSPKSLAVLGERKNGDSWNQNLAFKSPLATIHPMSLLAHQTNSTLPVVQARRTSDKWYTPSGLSQQDTRQVEHSQWSELVGPFGTLSMNITP